MSLKEFVDHVSFRQEVATSVYYVLEGTFGRNCSQAIIRHLMRRAGLKSLDDVADQPEKFETFLHEVFGIGASLLLKRIAIDISRKLNIEESIAVSRPFTKFITYIQAFYVI